MFSLSVRIARPRSTPVLQKRQYSLTTGSRRTVVTSVTHGELELHLATLIRSKLPKDKWVVSTGEAGYMDSDSVKGLS